ncbi:MAG: MIP family channel protein [Firmicutes bacterium]|nr:MIP family channel protein [Bacillota bacterium]
MGKKCLAEFIGTAVLVTFGCGVAATNGFGTGYVGIALAFGLVIIALAYSIGNISGCHINPAVSVAMLINKKLTPKEFLGYVISQFLGGILGALILYLIFVCSNTAPADLGLGTNGYGTASNIGISMTGAFMVEILLTFVFVFSICGVTSKEKFGNAAGLVIGFSLTLVHLFGLPLTGTSVNPARSFGPALVAALSGVNPYALMQVWVFVVAPLVGGALAAVIYDMLGGNK